MIKGIIFDLDGTLVQTEILKAISYARAVEILSPRKIREKDVIEAYRDFVGLPRQEVAQGLLKLFKLEDAAQKKMSKYKVPTSWQVLSQIRINIYGSILTDPKILYDKMCPYNIALLHWAKSKGYLTGLATMSSYSQANRILQILNLTKEFNFIATADDIEHGKPDPEIYLLVSSELNISPHECLVIEDSASGIKAALSAQMWCIASTSDFTRRTVHESGLLDKRWIVDDPVNLEKVVKKLIREKEKQIIMRKKI